MSSPNYKNVQKELTELNADGNEDRGREGEELPKIAPCHFYGRVSQEDWVGVLEALHFNGEADK